MAFTTMTAVSKPNLQHLESEVVMAVTRYVQVVGTPSDRRRLEFLQPSAERNHREQMLGACLSHWLQVQLECEAGWDVRYAWLDGTLILDHARTEDGTVTLAGAAYVVENGATRMEPFQVLLRPDTAEKHLADYTIRLGDRSRRGVAHECFSMSKFRLPETGDQWRYSIRKRRVTTTDD